MSRPIPLEFLDFSKSFLLIIGLNYTTGDANAPVKYSDGSSFNKSVDFSFDDDTDKFGAKECNYMKKGVQYKPRDTDCSAEKAPICIWNSKSIHSQSFVIYI